MIGVCCCRTMTSAPAWRCCSSRHAFEVQAAAGAVTEVQDPVEADPGALGRLGVPAIVTAGEFDMPDFRAGAEALVQRLGDARHAVIAGAGHLAPLDRPEAFRELLLDFLSESAARDTQRGS
jgi:pimeloyl-ACP methyl ester carboxylesterase